VSRGLPSEAIVGLLLRPLKDGEKLSPDNFAANAVFVELMQGVIGRRGPWVSSLIAAARRLGEGTLQVADLRTRAAEGEIPQEDVFGEFDVKDGKIVLGSYRPNSLHFIFSAAGFFQLGAELEECLVEVLAAIPDPDDPGDGPELGSSKNPSN
jgi:hypothetical protein